MVLEEVMRGRCGYRVKVELRWGGGGVHCDLD